MDEDLGDLRTKTDFEVKRVSNRPHSYEEEMRTRTIRWVEGLGSFKGCLDEVGLNKSG